jgi:4-amino-4-deoxy-L-arabinose transferase-like glycosyltransferase
VRLFKKKSPLLFYFCFFLLYRTILWTLLPWLNQPTPPIDVVEGFVWGEQWQWGYDKHPPLAPWLTYLTGFFTPISLCPTYFLSSLSVAATYAYVWRFLSRFTVAAGPLIFLSILCLDCVYYYTHTAMVFNPNTIILPLWAAAIYYGANALTYQRSKDWVIVGLLCGLGMLAKYFFAMLIIPMALLIMCAYKQSFRAKGAYVGLVCFIALLLPHVVWLWKHDFSCIAYGCDKVVDQSSFWWQRITFPLTFGGYQVLALLPCLFLAFLGKRSKTFDSFSSIAKHKYLFYGLTIGPFALVLTISFVFKLSMYPTWGMTLLLYIPFIILSLVKRLVCFDVPCKKLAGVGCVIVTLQAVMYMGFRYTYPHRVSNTYFPAQSIADDLTDQWRQTYDQPLPYLLGVRSLSGALSLASKDRPVAVYDASLTSSPWVKWPNLKEKGALVVWVGDPPGFLSEIPHAIWPASVYWGYGPLKQKHYVVQAAVIAPNTLLDKYQKIFK